MPKIPPGQLPRLRKHPRGYGIVSLAGEDHILGPFHSPDCQKKYDELIARWLAGGRKSLKPAKEGRRTVGELASAYAEFARGFYRKRGTMTSFGAAAVRAMDVLLELYGSEPIDEFDRAAFKLVRAHWLNIPNGKFGASNTRDTVNRMAGIVRAAFRWGADHELRYVPASVWAEVAIPAPLRRGRTEAPEGRDIGPAPEDAVEAVLRIVRAALRDLLSVMKLTGMRPAEVCGVRPGFVDRSGPAWVYAVPGEWNKNDHKALARVVAIGPRAQAILGPRLDAHARSGFPVFGTYRGNPYAPQGVAQVVAFACRSLGVAHWTPSQLRHNAATAARARFGLDGAQVMLGHKDADVTQIYAEKDLDLAARIAAEIG